MKTNVLRAAAIADDVVYAVLRRMATALGLRLATELSLTARRVNS